MRFTSALAVAAICATGVDALKKYTKTTQDIVNRTREHLEQIHGKGLTGLYDEHGRFAPHHLKKSYKSSRLNGTQI